MTSDSRLPRISIGLPVYNGERYLRETLGSLLGQTFGDFELILSDNASTDGTEAICREYAAVDPRVRYVRQPRNLGANENYNQVVRMSRGPFVKWSAHDDVCAPRYLERTVPVLEREGDAVLCHSRPVLIDERGERLCGDGVAFYLPTGEREDPLDPPLSQRPVRTGKPHVRLRDVLLNTKWCFEIFGVIRKDALLRTGLLRPYYGSDKAILAELALLGPWRSIDEELWFRRCRPGTSTNMSVREKARWSDQGHRRSVLPVANMLVGYLAAVNRTPLPRAERLRCYAAVLEKAVERDNFHDLLVPGPSNYFGIGNRPSSAGPQDART